MTDLSSPPFALRKRKAALPLPARHQWVKQWLVAEGAALRRLVADTLVEIDRFEELHHSRQRARRPKDRQSHEGLVAAVVVNLALVSIDPPPTGRLAIRAGNAAKGAGRQNNPVFGKGVRPLLDQMHAMGLLDFQLPTAGTCQRQ